MKDYDDKVVKIEVGPHIIPLKKGAKVKVISFPGYVRPAKKDLQEQEHIIEHISSAYYIVIKGVTLYPRDLDITYLENKYLNDN